MTLRSEPRPIPDAVLRDLAEKLSRRAEAIAVGDRAGVVEWANTAWRRVTGWPLEDVVEKPVSELLERIGVERPVLDFVRGHFVAGRRCAVELAVDDPAGRHRTLQLEVEPLVDERGEVARFLAIVSDTTARRDFASDGGSPTSGARARRAAAGSSEADSYAAGSEALVAAALDAAREVGRLCSEIERTAALGLLDELGARSVRERAVAAGDRARGLLDRSTSASLARVPVDLSSVAQSSLDAIAAELSGRVEIDAVLAPSLPAIEVDACELGSIVRELMRAGAESIEDGWGTLSVTTGTTVPGRALASSAHPGTFAETLDDESARGFIEIHDTGPSLSSDDVRRVAEPVLPSPESPRVQVLVEARARLCAAGMRLTLRSTPGCGTCVLLSAPIPHA